MRAVVCREFGPPESLSLEEMPSPTVAEGQVRLAVKAAAFNFADTLIIQGKYQERPPFPFIPGAELAGEVTEVGAGVAHLKVGDRVFGLASKGAFATEAVTEAAALMPMPPNADFAEAAAFPIAYGTSHLGLTDRARLKAGETLLVLGAAGGVGLTAVEIGKALGARVVAAASSPEKLAAAKAAGADETIDYSEGDFRAKVKAVAPKGVDVVYDPVGGDLFEPALRSLAWNGRHIVIGFASGTIPQIPANLLLVKNIAVLGLFWGNYRFNDPKTMQASLRDLIGLWAGGKLTPTVSHRLPPERFAEGFHLLAERKATGKVVLMMA